jgi:hypothetical protein
MRSRADAAGIVHGMTVRVLVGMSLSPSASLTKSPGFSSALSPPPAFSAALACFLAAGPGLE